VQWSVSRRRGNQPKKGKSAEEGEISRRRGDQPKKGKSAEEGEIIVLTPVTTPLLLRCCYSDNKRQ
jgi:hypothetical protein